MNTFIVLALYVVGAYGASYGLPAPVPEIRVVSSGYSAPAPVVRSSYEAPVLLKSSYAPSYAPLPEIRKPIIPIVRFELNDDNYGTFNFDSLSGDGTKIVEEGHLKNLGDPEGPVTVMSGSYSFIGDDGKTYSVTWVADENGFRAAGDHLPTPPPIPAEHLRLLSSPSYSSAPVIRDSYAPAPVIRTESYSAPAPVIRTESYAAPAPIRIVSSGY